MENVEIGVYEFSFSPRSFGGKRALIASVREDGFPFVLDRLVLDEHDQHLQAKIKQWLIHQEAKDIDVIYFEKLIVSFEEKQELESSFLISIHHSADRDQQDELAGEFIIKVELATYCVFKYANILGAVQVATLFEREEFSERHHLVKGRLLEFLSLYPCFLYE